MCGHFERIVLAFWKFSMWSWPLCSHFHSLLFLLQYTTLKIPICRRRARVRRRYCGETASVRGCPRHLHDQLCGPSPRRRYVSGVVAACMRFGYLTRVTLPSCLVVLPTQQHKKHKFDGGADGKFDTLLVCVHAVVVQNLCCKWLCLQVRSYLCIISCLTIILADTSDSKKAR